MTIVERVRAICKERKIPISKLEKDLGFGNGYIGQLKKGVLPGDRLLKICEYLNVSPEYLCTGEENSDPFADDEGVVKESASRWADKDIRLLMWFRSLPEEKQRAILFSQDAPKGLV